MKSNIIDDIDVEKRTSQRHWHACGEKEKLRTLFFKKFFPLLEPHALGQNLNRTAPRKSTLQPGILPCVRGERKIENFVL